MAIENAKLLNVRIKNKYDSYENWASSGLVLEPGEIAIAHTNVDIKVDNGTVKQPALLMKVGDGEKTFANLPWLSAKAADVLSVCKNETELTAFVNSVIADAGIASDEAMEALAGRVTTTEGAIKTLQEAIGENGSVAKQIEDAIAALNLAETYAAKEHKHVKADITDFAHNHEMSEVNGLVDALAGKQAAGNYSLEGHKHVMADVTDLADELAKYQLAGDYSVEGHKHEIADVNGLTDALAGKEAVGEAAKVQSALDAYIESNNAAVALKADQTALNAVSDVANAAVKQADYDVKVAALEAEDVRIAGLVSAEAERAAGVESGLDARLDKVEAFFEGAAEDGEGLQNALDTLVEIQTYVDTHGEVADQMVKDIATNKKAIEDHVTLVNHDFASADAALKTELEGKINAKADALTVTNLETALDARLDVLEAINHEAYKTADATLKSDLEGQIALKADASVVSAMDAAYKAADEALDARLDVLEAIDHDAYKAADTALKNELTPLIDAKAAQTELDALEALVGTEKVADQIDAKIEALDLANIYEEKGAAAKALTDAKAYADGKDTVMNARVEALEAKDVVLYSDTIVFDCGTSAN